MSKSRPNSRLLSKINNIAVSSVAPTAGQALVYNGTQWTPGAPTGLGNYASPAATVATNNYVTFTGSAWAYATVTSSTLRITSYTGTVSSSVTATLTLTGTGFTATLVSFANTVPIIYNYISSTSATVLVPSTTAIGVFLYLVETTGRFTFIKVR